MTERLAEAADVDETKVFDRIRSRFIQECAEHFDQGRGIAAVVEDPDNYFWHLMEMCVLAGLRRFARALWTRTTVDASRRPSRP